MDKWNACVIIITIVLAILLPIAIATLLPDAE